MKQQWGVFGPVSGHGVGKELFYRADSLTAIYGIEARVELFCLEKSDYLVVPFSIGVFRPVEVCEGLLRTISHYLSQLCKRDVARLGQIPSDHYKGHDDSVPGRRLQNVKRFT